MENNLNTLKKKPLNKKVFFMKAHKRKKLEYFYSIKTKNSIRNNNSINIFFRFFPLSTQPYVYTLYIQYT